MKRVVIAVGLIVGLSLPLWAAQPFPTILQIALNQLTTGVIPYQILRMIPDGYVNFGDDSGEDGYGFRDSAGTIQFKQDGGTWVSLPASGTFPIDAPYITRTPDGDLTNETALSTLATALLLNTTATGVPVAYAGTSCTNQVVVGLDAVGAATCADVDLSTLTLAGTLGVANGGTGLTTGTSGGILGFTGTTTLASSALLTQDALLVGGGAGALPAPLGSLGTTTTVLHGNAAGVPSFAAVDLTTTVSGVLPTANGGTGSAFFAVAGPASTAKTYTFPNASTTVLTTNAAVTAAQGGTGLASYTTGDLIVASGATTLASLAGASTGNALISGGVGAAPTYGKIGLTTHVSGTLPVTSGGTNLTSYTTGDLIVANSGTSLASLAAVAAGQVLTSTGVGTAPAWSATPSVTTLLAEALEVLGPALGDPILTLSTDATLTNPAEVVSQYRAATTTATPAALATVTIPEFTTVQIQCMVTARRTGGAAGTAEDGAGYIVNAVYKNVAGTATEIGEDVTVVGEDQVGFDASFAPSSGTAVLSVTGATDNNVTWHATCRTWGVNT